MSDPSTKEGRENAGGLAMTLKGAAETTRNIRGELEGSKP